VNVHSSIVYDSQKEYYSTFKKNSLSHSGYHMPDRLRVPLEAGGAVLANRSLAR